MKELLKNYHKLSKEKQKLVKLLLKEQGIDINEKIILPQTRDKKYYDLSYAQQRLWFLEKLEPNSPLYIIPSGVKIVGDVNVDYLLEAMQMIVDRHEILRTLFVEKDGKGFQEIVQDLKVKPIIYNISQSIEPQSEIDSILKKEFTSPFKLSELPLFRFVVINVTEQVKYLLLPMHHIISDNWSTGILIKEILEIYNHKAFDRELDLEPIDIQYLDYSIWQKEWLSGKELQKQKDFWIDQLKGSNEILEIIPDKKRPLVQTYNGSFKLFNINSSLSENIEKYCKKNDITPFVFFLAAYQFLLAKYSHQNDINIGIPIANRNRNEIEPLIGFFINTLVLRGIIDYDESVHQFLLKTRDVANHAYENQDIPFEMIVDELGLERDMSHTALFQAMLVLNNAPMTRLNIEGLQIDPIDFDTLQTKFDLILSLTKIDGVYSCKFEYNTDLFNSETIDNIINQFSVLLNQFLVSNKCKLKDIVFVDIDNIKENKSLLSNRKQEVEEKSFVHKKFIEVAKSNPNKVAISDGDNSYTFEELNKLSDLIANDLISNGIKPEQTIGVFLNRRIEYVAAILGIFKSGGVFVPLDVTLPKDRLDYIINNAKIKSIITVDKFKGEIESLGCNIIDINKCNLNSEINELSHKLLRGNAAYIIYTSGSTGLPKGVVVEHSKIYSHITRMIGEFGVTKEDKYLAFAAFNFDPSLEQIFVPLLSGAEVFLRDDNYWMPSDFIELIKKDEITIINPPTVYWNQFVLALKNDENFDLGKLRMVIAGGEEMKPELLSIWKEIFPNNIQLVNAYGPTETIITSSILKIDDEIFDKQYLHIPIGKGTCGRNVYVIDENYNFVPEGIPGELCFGNELLARGYQLQERETAEKFIPNPFTKLEGERMYRTGDLVRYNQEGLIEYLGRIDDQVKVRGFRIELGEIEEVLLKNILVENVTVNIVNREDNNYIVAYVVSDSKEDVEEQLIKYCSDQLPNYMVPSRIIHIEKLPININGKLDKKLLPIPDSFKKSSRKEFIEPRTDLEKEIAGIVAKVLGVAEVGVFDNFFELGGHSILAIKVISEVKETFGIDIQLKNLFENPTVEGLSEAVITEQSNLLEDDELESLLGEIDEIE